MFLVHWNLLTDQALDVAQPVPFSRFAERQRTAVSAGSCGPADAVDVGLGFVGNVEVDDEGNAFDVDPARRDVGGDQYTHGTIPKLMEGSFSRALGLVSVDCFRADPARC